jgi:hypothetical protein
MQDELTRLHRETPEAVAPDTAASTPVGTGQALEGKIQVTVSGGRVSQVQLDPRAMRIPSEDLAAAFRDAANAAIDDQNSQASAGLPNVPSVDQLSRTLNEISADSVRAMEQAAQGIRDAISAVQRVSETHRRRR